MMVQYSILKTKMKNYIHLILFVCFLVFHAKEAYTQNISENDIAINLPTIKDSFFEQYYVVNEYVRVENNKLYWKGEVYIKR